MSLPAILVSGYFALGLAFAFVVVLGKKKRSGLLPSEEPPLFWLYLALWPVMALLWFATDEDNE